MTETTIIEFKFVLNADKDVFITGIRYPDVGAPWHLFTVDDQPLKQVHPKLFKVMGKERIDPAATGATGGRFRVPLKKDVLGEYLTHGGRFWFKGVLLPPAAPVGIFKSGDDPAVHIAAFRKKFQRLPENKRFANFISSIPEEDQTSFKVQSLSFNLEQLYDHFKSRYTPIYQQHLGATFDGKFREEESLVEFLEQKCSAYLKIGVNWDVILMLLQSKDINQVEVQDLIKTWNPTDLPDLLAKAARYDEVQALKKVGLLDDADESEEVEEEEEGDDDNANADEDLGEPELVRGESSDEAAARANFFNSTHIEIEEQLTFHPNLGSSECNPMHRPF